MVNLNPSYSFSASYIKPVQNLQVTQMPGITIIGLGKLTNKDSIHQIIENTLQPRSINCIKEMEIKFILGNNLIYHRLQITAKLKNGETLNTSTDVSGHDYEPGTFYSCLKALLLKMEEKI